MRYLTTAGMNQLKSKRASSPASEAREGEQDQIATPAGGKVRGGEDLRAGAAGFLDQHLAGVDAGEDEVVALVVDGQSG